MAVRVLPGSSADKGSQKEVAAGRALWQEALEPGHPAGDALRSMRVAVLQGSGGCRTLFVHAGWFFLTSLKINVPLSMVSVLVSVLVHPRAVLPLLRALCRVPTCRAAIAGLKPNVLREAATLARQDLSSLSPAARVEVLDKQLSGAHLCRGCVIIRCVSRS